MAGPPHLDEERLSASVDGGLDPAEAAHAAGCPECASRVAAWCSAAELVSVAPPPPPDAQRDAAVRAALEVTSTVPLATRRRWLRSSPGHGIAAAVAAALIIAGVVAAVASQQGGSVKASSSAGGTLAPASTAAGSSAGGAGAVSGAASAPSSSPPGATRSPSPAAPATAPPLGRYDNPSSLATALRAELQAQHIPPSEGVSSSAFESCLASAAATAQVPAGSSPDLEATLTYRGSSAEVFVFSVNGGHRAAVVKAGGCQPLAALSL